MSERVVAVIQARMTSTRLPGKVLLPLAGRPLVGRVIERVAAIPAVDAVAVAVPDGPEQQQLIDIIQAIDGIVLSRGPEDDVLRRTLIAAEAAGADVVVRITSDCPYVDPDVSGAVLGVWRLSGLPYARTSIERGFPLGFDTEVLATETLRLADREAVDPYEREHVTPFMWRQPDRFPAVQLECRPDVRRWRLVVDTVDDYELACRVYDELGSDFRFGDLRGLFSRQPDLLEINAHLSSPRYVGLPPPSDGAL